MAEMNYEQSLNVDGSADWPYRYLAEGALSSIDEKFLNISLYFVLSLCGISAERVWSATLESLTVLVPLLADGWELLTTVEKHYQTTTCQDVKSRNAK